VYAPLAKGRNAKGADIDFSAPAFIEDFGVVEAVRRTPPGQAHAVSTMLQAAQAKGLTTAAVGPSSGAAFIQDYKPAGSSSTKTRRCRLVSPRNCNRPVTRFRGTAAVRMRRGALTLANDNGDPTAPIPIQRLKDGQTANPLDRTGALSGAASLT